MPLIGIATVIVFVFLILEHKNRKARALRVHRNWLRAPEVDQYMKNNLKNGGRRQGIYCCHCGSRSIRQPGVDNRYDRRRIHICNMCNTTLYRTYR